MTDATPLAPDPHLVTSDAQLTTLYGEASPASLTKEVDYLTAEYRTFVEKAPFVILASVGSEGLDCTPRGDPAGFVRVVDARTVLIPDRRGNNRIDTLRNIVRDPRISLLFLIPGVGETLRINGRAEITTDPQLCASFAMDGKLPKSVLRVKAERVYFQCPKALIRSRLWSPDAIVPRDALPSAGQIMQGIKKDLIAAEIDRTYPDRIKQTMY
jgi:hypothetical protein